MDENPFESPGTPNRRGDVEGPRSRWVVQALAIVALAVVAMYFALDFVLAWVREKLAQ